LIVYPDGPSVYHYESAEYYTVSSGHPLYDPAYDRGGLVLIELNTDEIPLDIYQAQNISGFVLDEENQGFFINDNSFDLIVDGFSNGPHTYTNIVLVFDSFDPDGCVPFMSVDAVPAVYDPGCGWHCPLGGLEVSTPTPDGNNCSDTMTCLVQAVGCLAVRVWAFDDENGNLIHDGGECFSAFSHDTAIPIQGRTWGSIKINH